MKRGGNLKRTPLARGDGLVECRLRRGALLRDGLGWVVGPATLRLPPGQVRALGAQLEPTPGVRRILARRALAAVSPDPRRRAAARRKRERQDGGRAFKAWLKRRGCHLRGRADSTTGRTHRCWGGIEQAHVIRTRGADPGQDGCGTTVPLCRLAHALQEGATAAFETRYGLAMPLAVAAREYGQRYRTEVSDERR